MIASNITAAPLAHLGPQVPPAHSAAGLVAVAAQCAGPSYALGGRAHTRFKKRPPCLRTPVHFDAGPNRGRGTDRTVTCDSYREFLPPRWGKARKGVDASAHSISPQAATNK